MASFIKPWTGRLKVASARLETLTQNKRQQETLTLGSAITASAAAFNSNMGSLSMTLGSGVTFLCTALNLRLGLWLPHPLSKRSALPDLWPGCMFLREMFGRTFSGVLAGPVAENLPAAEELPVAEFVHLSDGGHFENLALYELVRRHCRYVIVCDCGADPEVAFDDFGNAVRRIREDFGVEIEVDLSPLKPDAARLSRQHVAVGTICYDPRADQKDIGILLYFKPTLTGDEPCDIAQYRTRNKDFPHETTGDQFYDEAQWESYRRLGEHAVRSALRFVERGHFGPVTPENVFSSARFEWYQSPDRLNEQIVVLTGRLSALEAALRENGPQKLIQEMYPELHTIDPGSVPVSLMTSEEMRQTLHFLVQIMQLMEDVWLSCNLDTHFNDPNNLGWMNTFQRWAYTPSFRFWWPLLKPMYGSKFRRFMEEQLDLADGDHPAVHGEVRRHAREHDSLPRGLAETYWVRMQERIPERQKWVFTYDLKLTLQAKPSNREVEIQAGLAFISVKDDERREIARWETDEFFVPPSLWGSGMGRTFLQKLLGKLGEEGIRKCEVTISSRMPGAPGVVELLQTDLASRQERNDLIAFYKRAGFRSEGDGLVLCLPDRVGGAMPAQLAPV